MSDSYQAVYDAVRSRISGCDVGGAIESALRDAFGSAHQLMQSVAFEHQTAGYEQQRPSVLMRPAVKVDGDQWCALYGDNLQDGVAGFGDSPDAAMRDFDKAWTARLLAGRHP